MVQTGTLKLKSAKSIVEILIFEVSDIEKTPLFMSRSKTYRSN